MLANKHSDVEVLRNKNGMLEARPVDFQEVGDSIDSSDNDSPARSAHWVLVIHQLNHLLLERLEA
jgi:hypothetical protein